MRVRALPKLGAGNQTEIMIREVIAASPVGVNVQDIAQAVGGDRKNVYRWVAALVEAGEVARVEGRASFDVRLCLPENAQAARESLNALIAERDHEAVMKKRARAAYQRELMRKRRGIVNRPAREARRRWAESTWEPPKPIPTSIWHYAEMV